MCMTSNGPLKGGYKSPSPLPYTEDLPLPACQLAALQSPIQPILANRVATESPTPVMPMAMSMMSIASAADAHAKASQSSSPSSSPSQMPLRLKQQQPRRRSALQELPLPLRKRSCETSQERFAAFVAILLMHLDGGVTPPSKSSSSKSRRSSHSNPNYKLTLQAKALVQECCRRNQMGDAHFTPLHESLSDRLHGLVGDYHWNRARVYLRIYLARHHGFDPARDETDEDRQLLHCPPAGRQQPAVTTSTTRANTVDKKQQQQQQSPRAKLPARYHQLSVPTTRGQR